VKITAERLAHLRTASEVGMRMSGLQPHTVQVRPDELAALVAEVDRLNAALTRIADHPHQAYDCAGSSHANASTSVDPDTATAGRMYEVGAVDGHRCAAEVARTALGRNTP